MNDGLQRACVSLAIIGDDLIPSEVTALLGVAPRRSISKGETFFAHGKQIQAKTGSWSIGGEWRSPPDLDSQIGALFSILTSDSTVWRELTSRFACYVCVGGHLEGWTGGIMLQPVTLAALAERGVAIDFDLYARAASE